MNERINELFGEALDQAVPETWTKLSPTQLLKVKDKFAELIVRECATVCEKVSDTTRIDDTPHEGDVCSYKIKQHFGVEE